MSPAIALIGGMDPSGGAGLLRDSWTVETRDPDLRQIAVCTALTRQAEGRPLRVSCAAPAAFASELERVAAAPDLAAVKIGMVPGPLIAPLLALVEELGTRERRPALVLDPVADASEGGRLGAPASALAALVRRVDLVTPNRAERLELDAVLGQDWGPAVLIKAEASADRPDRVCDRLVSATGELVLDRPRVRGPDPRGTGCALASAIAAELARGRSLTAAVVAGVAWLDGARRHLRVGPDGRYCLLPPQPSRTAPKRLRFATPAEPGGSGRGGNLCSTA